MIQEREFDRLEQFVNRLLAQFNQLREEKGQLESQLKKRDSEIAELKTELFSADSARGDITARVKGLIEQIEEWESTLNEAETETETEIVAELELEDETEAEAELELEAEIEDEVDQAATLADPVVEETVEEEKDGGLQQSLFNVEPRPTNIDG